MKIIWELMRSALAIPKRTKKKLKPKPLARRRNFRPHVNVFKPYKNYPSEKMRTDAEIRRQEQVARQWPAEMALKPIFERIGCKADHQYIIYYPGGYLLADWYVPAHKLRVEADGKSHDLEFIFDNQRDTWLRNNMGIQTLRFKNIAIFRSPNICEKVIRVALGKP